MAKPCALVQRLALFHNAAGAKPFWTFYRGLKAYKEMPDEAAKIALERCFDEIFVTETCSAILNAALRRLARNKEELLLVLDRPDILLHNNPSECDIREYVQKRKISGNPCLDLRKLDLRPAPRYDPLVDKVGRGQQFLSVISQRLFEKLLSM